MNTTHRAPRARVEVPPLPTEIWLKILERACVAGVWNPYSVENAVDFSVSSTRSRKKSYRQSLVTKRYVVRVCKQWNIWTLPYLYENVCIGRRRCLRPLRDALMKCTNDDHVLPTSHHCINRLIKRLDIALRDDLSMPITGEEENRDISEIIQRLPNLIILNFACTESSFSFATSIIDSLINTCGPNLKAVTWNNRATDPEPLKWHTFLEKAGNIRVLSCPDYSTILGLSPALSSLELLRCGRELPCGIFPSLRHVISDVHLETGDWRPFLDIHGEKLEVIQLNLQHHYMLSPLLALFSTLCPKLARLDLSVPGWDLIGCQEDGCELKLPPSIQVLGLQNRSLQAPSQGYRSLFSGLDDMQLSPSLRCVQLIDCGNVKDLTRKHKQMMKFGVDLLKKRGLELRDHEGSLIAESLPEEPPGLIQ